MPDLTPNSPAIQRLLWLADAPLFIDADQVARFHDAVVRPDFEVGSATLEVTKENASKLAVGLGAEAKVKPNALLEMLSNAVPFIKAELRLKAEVNGEIVRTSTEGQTVELKPINNPQRQLEQLILHYLLNHPDRLLMPSAPTEASWRQAATISAVPRALVLLDFPPGTKFIPAAAELKDGRVQLIFQRLRSKDGRQTPPKYPENGEPDLPAKRKDYWSWFDANFNDSKAMIAVEEAVSDGGAIRWIDYRVPIGTDGDTVHLHVAPALLYDTGTFAYYFVKRGFKHGVRVIGTLKSEPEINVLAIYEK